MSANSEDRDSQLARLAGALSVNEAALRELVAVVQQKAPRRRLHWRWAILIGIVASGVTLGIDQAVGAADAPGESEVVPLQIPFRGVLDMDGAPVTASALPMTFELFDSSGAGTAIWREERTGVPVVDGIFNVDLGNCVIPESSCPMGALAPVLARKPPVLYIGIRVKGVALQGRQRLLSVPYAERATWSGTADRAINGVPPGSIVAFAGATPPTGWLLCNGAEVRRTEHPELFATIGIAHGSGDGSTTFRLPDYRGRFLRGADLGAKRDPDATARQSMQPGGITGDNVGTVQDSAAGPHDHQVRDPGHQHAIGPWQVWCINGSDPPNYCSIGANGSAANNPPTNTSTTGVAILPDTGHAESRPVNAAVNYIIKS